MQLMLCIRGEKEQLPYLEEIHELGAGLELGSYGMIGIKSIEDWQLKLEQHKIVVNEFHGKIALHGPFIGVEYAHIDHIIRGAIEKRLDMIFDVAVQLKVSRIILHSCFRAEMELYKIEAYWYERNLEYWKREIQRWANANIEVVLENEIEKNPNLLVKLIDEVNNPFLGLCLDIGHHNLFSNISASEWVKQVGHRLYHIHLHDNDGVADRHWPIGKGNIDFKIFFKALEQYAPKAIVSLEVDDLIEVKMNDLRKLSIQNKSNEN